eukprot:5229897-Pyramimonas_sp.AAC.1
MMTLWAFDALRKGSAVTKLGRGSTLTITRRGNPHICMLLNMIVSKSEYERLSISYPAQAHLSVNGLG